jgi:hypothetical protein
MDPLELTMEEAETLGRVLRSALSQLHDEIAHTDDRAYREALKRDRECIEQIAGRLPRSDAGGS